MELMINKAGMKEAILDMGDAHKNMQKAQKQVSDIANTLVIQGGGSEKIKNTMKVIVSDMNTLIQKLARMENGLDIVLNAYYQCEKNIIGIPISNENNISVNHSSSNEESAIEEIRNWFRNLLDEIKQWKEDWDEKREEKKADKHMQDEIEALLKSERFSKATWKKASVEEREKILRELFEELKKIYDVDVSDIYFDEISSEPGYITYGYLRHTAQTGNMTITINKDLLESSSDYDSIMNTMFHEMRHGYQHSVCDNPQKYESVREETIEAWRDNFNDYRTVEDDGFSEYRNQPVEKDARKFADGVIRK